MEKYKAFIVPFATKGYFSSNETSHKILGRAYYLYDKNLVIYKQFIQLDEATFRPTDKEMMKTSYYNSNYEGISIIRKIFLENYQKNLNFLKDDISKESKIRIKIKKDLLIQINKELIKLSKVKRSLDIFVGSNSTGAKTKKDASSIITYYKNDSSFSGFNFSNPFNEKEIFKENKNIKINSLNSLEIISLKNFLKLNNKALNIFEEYNFSQYYIFKNVSKFFDLGKVVKGIERENKLKNIDFSDSEWSLREKLFEIINSFKNKNFDFNENKKEIKNFERRLRNIQKLLVVYEIKRMYPNASFLNNNNNELFNSLENCFDANSEFSHIIPVRESIKDSDRYQEIADNNNCLLLSPSLHKNLDKFQIYFDHNSGNCIFLKENKVIENCAIKKEWLNNERKKYLKLYEDTFLKK